MGSDNGNLDSMQGMVNCKIDKVDNFVEQNPEVLLLNMASLEK